MLKDLFKIVIKITIRISLWIKRYLNTIVFFKKKVKSQDKISTKNIIKIISVVPSVQIKTQQYKVNTIHIFYTISINTGIALCPLPHSS